MTRIGTWSALALLFSLQSLAQAPSPSDCWDPTFCGTTIVSDNPNPTDPPATSDPVATTTAPPPTDPPSTSDPMPPDPTNPPASDPPPTDPPGCVIVSKVIDFRDILPGSYLYKNESYNIIAHHQPINQSKQVAIPTHSSNITLIPVNDPSDPDWGYNVELDEVGDAYIQFDFCDGDSFRIDFHIVDDPESVLSPECFGIYGQIKQLHEALPTCSSPPTISDCDVLWNNYLTDTQASDICHNTGGTCTAEIDAELESYNKAQACKSSLRTDCVYATAQKQTRCDWYTALKCDETWEAPECENN